MACRRSSRLTRTTGISIPGMILGVEEYVTYYGATEVHSTHDVRLSETESYEHFDYS